MVEANDYESELTASREEIAAVLSGVVDGILAGSIRLGDGKDAITVAFPEELALETELEAEDDELSLELELAWPSPKGEESGVSPIEDLPEEEGDELSAPMGAADASQALARFESSVTKASNGGGDSATAMGTSSQPVARVTHANTMRGKDSRV